MTPTMRKAILLTLLHFFGAVPVIYSLRGHDSTTLVCRIGRNLIRRSLEGAVDESFQCDMIQNESIKVQSIPIHLSESFRDEQKESIEQNSLVVQIRNPSFGPALRDGHPSFIDASASHAGIRVIGDLDRLLSKRRVEEQVATTKSLMVVRVSTSDNTIDATKDELFETYFSESKYSVKSQVKLCTRNEWDFEPWIDSGDAIIDVSLEATSSSYTTDTIFREASAKITELLGSSPEDLTQHAIFCLPPGLSGPPFLAMARTNSWYVLANSVWCNRAPAMIHEIMHNYGLGHAADGEDAYADKTSLMGYGAGYTELNRCFNGQNYDALDLFRDRRRTFRISDLPIQFEIVPFTQGEISDTRPLLVQVDDKYLVYNRKESFNRDTALFGDQVTITENTRVRDSEILGGVGLSDTIFQAQSSIGEILTFQVCEQQVGTTDIPDSMTIAVSFSDSPCEDVVALSLAETVPSMSPTSVAMEDPEDVFEREEAKAREPIHGDDVTAGAISYDEESVDATDELFDEKGVVDEGDITIYETDEYGETEQSTTQSNNVLLFIGILGSCVTIFGVLGSMFALRTRRSKSSA